MAGVDIEDLKNLDAVDKLAEIFSHRLNYQYVGSPVSARHWKERIVEPIVDNDVQLLGKHGDFHIIYCRISRLLVGLERPIITQLLREHPYLLVIFSDVYSRNWHFVNIKYDTETRKRRLFRRIVVGPDEKLHTAAQRISMLEVFDERISPLELQIKHDEAFDVEKVTKGFYTSILRSFMGLVGGEVVIGSHRESYPGFIRLPYTIGHNRKQEFATRLIGRIIFCWFLKKKKSLQGRSLIPEDLLSKESSEKCSNYYHTVLEPLFFQQLNTPMNQRKEQYRNSDIPFLNGGLFQPHRDDFYEFSELGSSKYVNALTVPDKWFKELLGVLERYNFTIDESTPLDVSLSIDPEILGRIFENLLAEINPETEESAKKSTGSYYTPRSIVEHMVTESIKHYLLDKTSISLEKLSILLSYDDGIPPLTEQEKSLVVDALGKLKVIDPACGSGAFPMGILQKVVLVLQKVDPDCRKWLKSQLSRIADPYLRKQVEHSLRGENFDYIRKLGIVQHTVYGVDIQPMAVEIARLRFFLSLIVDRDVDDSKENRGVEPLPNLEFKFVCANTLIGLPEIEKQFSFGESVQDINILKQLRNEYFMSFGGKKKKVEEEFKRIQERLSERVSEWHTKGKQSITLSTWNPFSADDPARFFAPEWMFGVSSGFDIAIANPPYVRADNPAILQQRKTILYSNLYKTLWEKWDLYVAFMERAYQLLRNKGILEFIISDAYMSSKYAIKSHKYFLENATVNRVNFCSEVKIFDASIKNIIVEFIKEKNPCNVPRRIKHVNTFENFEILKSGKQKDLGEDIFRVDSQSQKKFEFTGCLTWGEICYVSYGLRPSSDERYWKGEFKKKDLISHVRDEIHPKPYIEGKFITKWIVKEIRYLEWNTKRSPRKLVRPTFAELYTPEKIMMGGMTGAILDNNCLLCNHSITVSVLWKDLRDVFNRSIEGSIKKDFNVQGEVTSRRLELEKNSEKFNLKYLLAILNSKLGNYYLHTVRRSQLGFYPDDLKKLPIKKISQSEQALFIDLVDEILSIYRRYDYPLPFEINERVKELECQIDQKVYELYGLTEEEITLVEENV